MKKIRLGDYCTVSAGGDKPKVFSDIKTSECSVPVFANGIDNEGLVGFTNRESIESNSVTLSARGNTGTPFYRTKPYVPIIRLISVIPDKEYINCQYLYYLLKTRNISGTGSVQSQLTVPMVENITVPIIEDLKEQLKIATYLGNIDKKISNNNDISSQLESLAKTIYDYWFLQFDFPDENGRPYKSSGGKMVWSDELKREIPEGWKAGKLRDLYTIGNGRDHKSLKDGTYPVYGSGGIMRYADQYLYSGESVLIPRKGTLNNVMYVNGSFWTVDTMYFTEMKKPHSAIYSYFSTKAHDFERLNTGTGVPSMTSSLIYSLNAMVPSQKVLDAFDSHVKPLEDAIKKCGEENHALSSLRDFLLPMLMNGQVTFEDNI